jgi:acyl-CoA thioesterase-1
MIGSIRKCCPFLFKLFFCFFIVTCKGLANPTILVVGDSLSAEYKISTDSGWVNLLENKLKSSYPSLKIVNSSVSGNTTTQGLQKLPNLLSQYEPNIVLLQLGGNDGLRGLPLIHIQKNLQKMIQLCQKQKSIVVLLGVQIPPNYGPRYQERFFGIYGKLAKEYKTLLVPFILENVALNPKLMQADGIHPTADAQSIIMNNALSTVESALDRLTLS